MVSAQGMYEDEQLGKWMINRGCTECFGVKGLLGCASLDEGPRNSSTWLSS